MLIAALALTTFAVELAVTGMAVAQECEPRYVSAFVESGKPKFEIAAFGDSVMWGQGLRQNDKFAEMVAKWVRTQGYSVFLRGFAHSGATIRDQSGLRRVTHGEVPNWYPSIINQVTCIPPNERNSIDMVLVDGCINDAAMTERLPQSVTDPSLWDSWGEWVDKWSKEYCKYAMESLLGKLIEQYPRADIIVTGYFPLVSRSSNPQWLCTFLEEMKLPTHPLIGLSCLLSAETLGIELALRSDRWNRRSREYLTQSVEKINGMSGRIRLAIPSYTEANAMAAPNSWLYRASDVDPMEEERIRQSRPDGSRCENVWCREASVFHPNEAGAIAYRDSIISAIKNLWADPRSWDVTITPTPIDAGMPVNLVVNAQRHGIQMPASLYIDGDSAAYATNVPIANYTFHRRTGGTLRVPGYGDRRIAIPIKMRQFKTCHETVTLTPQPCISPRPPVPLDQRTEVVVTATDAKTNLAVPNARVKVSNPSRLATDPPDPPDGYAGNIAFQYTFRRKFGRGQDFCPTGRVTALDYDDALIRFLPSDPAKAEMLAERIASIPGEIALLQAELQAAESPQEKQAIIRAINALQKALKAVENAFMALC